MAIFLSVAMQSDMELTEIVMGGGGFDLVREVRDGFPKQRTSEMRSKLVLEKIHNNEKSEEENSRHQELPGQRA